MNLQIIISFIHSINIKTLCLVLSIFMVFWSPFSGGPRLGMLLLSIVGFYLLLKDWRTLMFEIPVRRWLIIFISLWSPIIFSLYNSFNIISTLSAAAWFSLIFFSGISILYGFSCERNQKYFKNWMFIIVIIWTHLSIIQLFFSPSFMPSNSEGRLSGLFGDLHQGTLLILITPLVYYSLINLNKNFLALYFVFIASCVTILSGSRIYFYMIALSLTLHLITKKNIKHLFVITVGLLLMLTILFVANEDLVKKKIHDTKNLNKLNYSTFNKFDKALTGRLSLWDAGRKMFIHSPITGVGAKNFKESYPKFANKDSLYRQFEDINNFPSHSHNIYIQLLSEVGLLGAVGLLYIFYLSAVWYKDSEMAGKKEAWPFIFPMIVFFFPINSTQPILTPWLFPIILIFYLGFLGRLNNFRKTLDNTE
jgi:O-antigen ligase